MLEVELVELLVLVEEELDELATPLDELELDEEPLELDEELELEEELDDVIAAPLELLELELELEFELELELELAVGLVNQAFI